MLIHCLRQIQGHQRKPEPVDSPPVKYRKKRDLGWHPELTGEADCTNILHEAELLTATPTFSAAQSDRHVTLQYVGYQTYDFDPVKPVSHRLLGLGKTFECHPPVKLKSKSCALAFDSFVVNLTPNKVKTS